MVTILTMMALGIMVGYFVRRMQLKWLDNVQIGFVWLLLFLLGAEAGGNERVVRWIASLGLEAFAISLGGVLGSSVLAMLLWRKAGREGGGK
ncbi:MAG: lysine exporter LysO family protein [Muribaculaceae bacterium]|nr:lysine exporter LysO family protein [Muribaculaceae bacterium]MDE5959554.1 lysine exporter LysO family protein [Muribaculaceae bacterium]MDE5972130.1 lysine exporter LysO family protein [Muribaculaceae bacterium]MDE6462756.1 lysine exporter LysO family protein [Muribaculaceae bacterium]